MSTFKKHPILFCLIFAFAFCFICAIVFLMKGGTIWTKQDDNLTHHGPVFTVKSRKALEGLHGFEFNFNITPEIIVRFKSSNLPVFLPPEEDELFWQTGVEVSGEIDIEGKFVRSWSDGDVRPAFTREEFLDKFLSAVRRMADEDSNIEFSENFLNVLASFDEAAKKEDQSDQETRTRSKLSHMFGATE